MAEAYSSDLRERVIRNYESGMPKEEIVSIFIIGLDTLNRWTRKYKETGSVNPCRRTKYRAEKFSEEALPDHVLKNSSAAPEERALFFSVTHQSVYARMKALGITRKERDEEKRNEFRKTEKGNNIFYIDK